MAPHPSTSWEETPMATPTLHPRSRPEPPPPPPEPPIPSQIRSRRLTIYTQMVQFPSRSPHRRRSRRVGSPPRPHRATGRTPATRPLQLQELSNQRRRINPRSTRLHTSSYRTWQGSCNWNKIPRSRGSRADAAARTR
jgi:hypothetical protein